MTRAERVAARDNARVTGHDSDAPLLVLHAVRLLGSGRTEAVAARFGLPSGQAEELLLDFEAYGWVARISFGGDNQWSLTDAGRAQNERLLAAEVDDLGVADIVVQAHAAFLPLNARLQEAVTRWQVRPMRGEPLAANDHTDHRWDEQVIDELAAVGRRLVPLGTSLAATLRRFDGYVERYARAVDRVEAGERRFVAGLGIDSCHTVWFQLHEDLLATRGVERGAER